MRKVIYRLLLRRLVVLAQGPNPDIPKAHGIAVFVKFDETVGRLRVLVISIAAVVGGAKKLRPMMNNHAVVQDGYESGFDQLFVGIPAGRFPDDVIGLPFPGWF